MNDELMRVFKELYENIAAVKLRPSRLTGEQPQLAGDGKRVKAHRRPEPDNQNITQAMLAINQSIANITK